MGKIFISYRRTDSLDISGRIYDWLVQRFGELNVFRDVDAIPLGADWSAALDEALANSGVMLVIIGPGWLKAQDSAGRRRLDIPKDYVRREIEAALVRTTLIIPVLVQGANMPTKDQLPKSIRGLVGRQLHRVRSDADFPTDMVRLIVAIMAASPTLASVTQEPLQRDQGGVAEDGENPDELVSAGWALLDLHPTQAVSLFKHATQLDPDNAQAWEGLGDAYWHTNLPEDAVNAYSRSLALAPENPWAWEFTARILNEQERHKDALAAYDRALTIEPTDWELWIGKADIFHALGRHEEALAAYDHALALNPRIAIAWTNKVLSLRALGRTAEVTETSQQIEALYVEQRVEWAEAFEAAEPGETPLWLAQWLKDLGK